MKTWDVPWAADQHTKAKHAVYRQYLGKWMPIIMAGFKDELTYAEGFSGPGVYLDGSEGSPVIALRALLGNPSLRTRNGKNIRYVFIDNDPRSIARLSIELTKAAAPVPLESLPERGIRVEVVSGACEPTLDNELTRLNAWGKPMLVVLDSWGSGVSLDLLGKIAANKAGEAIVTIQMQFFVRFAELQDRTIGDRVFGNNTWRNVAHQPSSQKTRWILREYRRSVARAGFKFILDFELVDEDGRILYLIFGTNHERGLQKMKEAMWEVDPINGGGYRDPQDPDQQTLAIEFEPALDALRRLVVIYLQSRDNGRALVNDIRRFALFETVYKEAQVMPALMELIQRGQIQRVSPGTPMLRGGDTVELVVPVHGQLTDR